MKTSRLLILVALLLPHGAPVDAEPRKGISVVLRDADGADLGGYTGSYALLVGVSHYTAGWPDLEGVPDELKQVEDALKPHGFQIDKVINPDYQKLKAAFESFVGKYGYSEGNRLLFFFSGHGYSRKRGQKGYLVPADAPDPRKDEEEFLRKALTMTDILAWSKKMEARHALFLFDSCFSGTIFKTKTLPKEPRHISVLTAKPVRQYITAGSAGEEVPAKSVFAACLVRALRGEADLTKDGYVTGTELGLYLREKVMHYRTGQTPQYGKIRDPELDEGDFVFVTGKRPEPAESVKPETERVEPTFFGTISLSSRPPGAGIYLDGDTQPRGKTPDTLKIDLGKEAERKLIVTLKLEGHEATTFELTAKRDKQVEVATVTLQKTVSPADRLRKELEELLRQVRETPVEARAREAFRELDELAKEVQQDLARKPLAADGEATDLRAARERLDAAIKSYRKQQEDAAKESKPLPVVEAKTPWKVYTEWPFEEREAKRRQKETADALRLPIEKKIDLGKDVSITFVLIPAGSFQMGSTESDDEKPVHKVTLTRPFYLGKYEVTQAEWQKVMGSTPWMEEKGLFRKRMVDRDYAKSVPKHAVSYISWNDCQAFMTKLNEQLSTLGFWEGSTGGKRFQFALPTEAEWEYACRAGSTTKYSFGDDASLLKDCAWFDTNVLNVGAKYAHAVGEKKPNAWGLYDMHGNVWEWCQDWYAGYPSGNVMDPTGAASGEIRVIRGGGWDDAARGCRSAFRGRGGPGGRCDGLGFRLALSRVQR